MGLIQTFKEKLMPIFFFGLAIYTMYTLVQSAAEVSREKLKLTPVPPTSRCVPFFDDVMTWNEDQHKQNKTPIVLYDYMAGQAIVRICTNESSTNVTSAITGFHGAVAYTPFSMYGCPLSEYRAKIGDLTNNGCVRVGEVAKSLSCNQIVNYAPCDDVCQVNNPPACCTAIGGCCQGYGFAFDVQPMTTNYTNSTTGKTGPYSKCTMRFEFLPGLPKCTGSWVGIFNTPGTNLKAFLWCVVAVPILVLLAQCYMLYKFDPAPPYDDDYFVSFAMRGIPGPIYQVYWIFIAKRGKFPAAKLTLPTFAACATQDAIEGLAAPIVAIYGCQLSRFPIPLALLIMKVIKFCIDLFLYMKDDGANDQHAELTPSTDYNKQVDDSSALTNSTNSNYQQQQPQMMMYQQQQQQPVVYMNNGYAQPPPQQIISNPQGGTQYTSTTEV